MVREKEVVHGSGRCTQLLGAVALIGESYEMEIAPYPFPSPTNLLEHHMSSMLIFKLAERNVSLTK